MPGQAQQSGEHFLLDSFPDQPGQQVAQDEEEPAPQARPRLPSAGSPVAPTQVPPGMGAPPLPPELRNPEEGLADIRDIADIPNPWVPWLIAAGSLLGACLVTLVGLWLFRKKPAPPEAPPSPYEIARRRLNEARHFMAPETAKAFASATSQALRGYLEGAWGLRVTSETTEEFLADAQANASFEAEERARLQTFLEQVDLVKFAGQSLSHDDMERLLTFAQDFIDAHHRSQSANPESTALPA